MSLYDRVRQSRTLPLLESMLHEKQQQTISRMVLHEVAEPEAQSGGQQKTLHFLVGAPGSGKSSVTRQHPGASVHSTDNYPGLYGKPEKPGGAPSIDFSKLGEAHAWNQKNAAEAMAKGHPHVVVDNTNTAAWQLAPYLHHAAKHGYKVHVTHVHAPLEDIRARGTHFPREKPAGDEPDRLAMMKDQADSFAKKLHSLKDHPAPMKQLDKEGAFHAPWEDTPEKQQDHSALHGLKYSIESRDTSSKR